MEVMLAPVNLDGAAVATAGDLANLGYYELIRVLDKCCGLP